MGKHGSFTWGCFWSDVNGKAIPEHPVSLETLSFRSVLFGQYGTKPRCFKDRPSATQGHQCLLSHFLASLGAQEKTNCTSMFWSIDSCQNRVSAYQYHLAVPGAQVFTHRGRVFFEVIRWRITSFKWSQAQVYFFQWFIWNMLCLCHYGPALLWFWFQTDFGRENSASFLKIQTGKIFSYHVTRWSRSTSN